jgi:hypothetical protein
MSGVSGKRCDVPANCPIKYHSIVYLIILKLNINLKIGTPEHISKGRIL